jgi:fructose transport system permease protein
VLGGTSLFGGRGAVLGTLIGALIVGIFRNGLQLMGVASIYQTLITGILVILAVTVDKLSRRGAR